MIRTLTRRVLAPTLMTAAAATAVVALAGGGMAAASSNKQTIPKAPETSLSETGSTLLYPLFNVWVPAYNKKEPQVSITTAGTGSGTGISDATNGTVDIGASDAYLSPTESKASPYLKNIPLAISAQIISYNITGVTAHLKLNGKVLTEIYEGQITNWDNSQIADLNKGVKLPNLAIVTLHRSDGSGDTFLFTQYLSKTDSTWSAKVGYNTTVNWPNAPGALAEDGNSGMVAGCKATPGCIAYIGISYLQQVLQSGLGEAQLQNAKGNYELPSGTTIAAEAASFTKKTPADGTISLIYGPASNGYPIINYEYAIVSTHQSSSKTATAMRSLLDWAIMRSDGNSSQYLSQVNFQPLPSSVEAQSYKQISDIK